MCTLLLSDPGARECTLFVCPPTIDPSTTLSLATVSPMTPPPSAPLILALLATTHPHTVAPVFAMKDCYKTCSSTKCRSMSYKSYITSTLPISAYLYASSHLIQLWHLVLIVGANPPRAQLAFMSHALDASMFASKHNRNFQTWSHIHRCLSSTAYVTLPQTSYQFMPQAW